ncbi:MAG: ClpX C4-type zinc finger protein [Actinomycetota bacterium]|nr:ClpX C4-type zinc finger protein [Actinomycetota bacterium]
MSLDRVVLAVADRARVRLERATAEADDARHELAEAVRSLHRAGGSVEEISAALHLDPYRIRLHLGTREAPEDPGTLRCAFCGGAEYQVGHLVAGPSVHICRRCVTSLVPHPGHVGARCAFCGHGGAHLPLAGGDPHICSSCLDASSHILADNLTY